jgi:monooxygenase
MQYGVHNGPMTTELSRESLLLATHHDVLIVGAGISGIGAAWHLKKECPSKSFAILEARGAPGGTWDLFRYPGIRSDSDMHTLGFAFRPWDAEKAIADGPAILQYLNDTVDESGLRQHIYLDHRVVKANWDSEAALWRLRIIHSGEERVITAGFVHMCSGYYDYEQPYTPEIEGLDTFAGTCVHPQRWPENLDYTDKRVVVVGSGATAMTLVPAMAATAASVTMVQRSPSYVFSLPDVDPLNARLRRYLPETWAYTLTRWKNIAFQRFLYHRTRVAPQQIRAKLLGAVRKALGPDYDVETHFTPSYDPWDQRLCIVPNADLFKAIRKGSASVVTGDIARVIPKGVEMVSGERVEADVLITATGLNLKLLAGVPFFVDGEPVDFAERYTYKGMMISGVPNLMHTFGYINASWTLRVDLNAKFACRLLDEMDRRQVRQVTPTLRSEDTGMPALPWITNFSSGYMQRSLHLFPRQGNKNPWRNTQNYLADRKLVGKAGLDDGALVFGNPAPREVTSDAA